MLSISISFERVFNFSASVSASYNLIKTKFSSSMSTSRINIWPSSADSLFLIKSFFRVYETNQNNARVRFTVRVKDAIFKIIFPLNVIIDSWMDFLKKHETLETINAWKGFTFAVFLVRIFPHLDWMQTDTPTLNDWRSKMLRHNSKILLRDL